MTTWRAFLRLGGPMMLLLSGCTHTMATAPFSDGTVVYLDGYGATSQVSLTCLSENQINQLTGGNTPPTAPKALCYEVAVITTKSSQISNAITAYLQANQNLTAQASAGVGAATPSIPNPVAQAATNAIVADIVAGKDSPQNAAGLKSTLSPSTLSVVATALKSLSRTVAVTNPAKSAALKSAADSVVP
jgi:hypothetical protein